MRGLAGQTKVLVRNYRECICDSSYRSRFGLRVLRDPMDRLGMRDKILATQVWVRSLAYLLGVVGHVRTQELVVESA